MKQIEISGLSLDWFQNYLNETKQCNMINGCHFSWADVVLGGGGDVKNNKFYINALNSSRVRFNI